MARKSTDELVARSMRAWTRKARWYGLWQQVYELAAPGMDPYVEAGGEAALRGENAGQPRHDHLFDGTLARAVPKLANRMTSELFPAGQDWADLRAGPMLSMGTAMSAQVEQDRNVQRVKDAIFEAIHSSNFYLAANMMILDAVVTGTGVMKVGMSTDSAMSIEFDPCSQAEVAFEAGPRGQVFGFYRKMWLTREHIVVMWPEADTKLPDEDEDADGGQAPRHFTVHEATVYDPQTGVWHYDVIVVGEGTGGHLKVFQDEYLVSPWVVYRYMQLPGEVQGRSPAMAAVPDARTANHAIRIQLESASMRSIGAFTYTADSGFNPRTTRVRSGALIKVATNSRENPSLRALEVGGDVNLNQIVIEDTRAAIRATMLDVPLPEPTGAVRSATEIIARQREAQLLLGSPYRRLAEEVGRPVLRAVAYHLAKEGLVPELAEMAPRDETGEPMPFMLDGTDMEIQFTSPHVTAEDLTEAQSIIQWAESCQRAFGPEAFMSGAKVEDGPATLAERMQVPLDLVRSEGERAQRMQQQQEAMAARGQPPQPQGAPV